MATDKAIENALGMLIDQLPIAKGRTTKGWEDRTFDLWKRKLADISDAGLAGAVDEAIEQLEFFPTWNEFAPLVEWHRHRHEKKEPLEYDWTAHTQEEADELRLRFKEQVNRTNDPRLATSQSEQPPLEAVVQT